MSDERCGLWGTLARPLRLSALRSAIDDERDVNGYKSEVPGKLICNPMNQGGSQHRCIYCVVVPDTLSSSQLRRVPRDSFDVVHCLTQSHTTRLTAWCDAKIPSAFTTP